MDFFIEKSSLKEMNELLTKRIPEYRIIGDLPLTREDFQHLVQRIQLEINENPKVLRWYKECTSV